MNSSKQKGLVALVWLAIVVVLVLAGIVGYSVWNKQASLSISNTTNESQPIEKVYTNDKVGYLVRYPSNLQVIENDNLSAYNLSSTVFNSGGRSGAGLLEISLLNEPYASRIKKGDHDSVPAELAGIKGIVTQEVDPSGNKTLNYLLPWRGGQTTLSISIVNGVADQVFADMLASFKPL